VLLIDEKPEPVIKTIILLLLLGGSNYLVPSAPGADGACAAVPILWSFTTDSRRFSQVQFTCGDQFGSWVYQDNNGVLHFFPDIEDRYNPYTQEYQMLIKGRWVSTVGMKYWRIPYL
jgi:hypothetical protein